MRLNQHIALERLIEMSVADSLDVLTHKMPAVATSRAEIQEFVSRQLYDDLSALLDESQLLTTHGSN